MPTLSNEHKELLEKFPSRDQISESVFKVNGGTSPGIDGLNIELIQKFWPKLKFLYFNNSLLILEKNRFCVKSSNRNVMRK